MNRQAIIAALTARKGQYVNIEGERTMETYKDITERVVKKVKFIARVGLDYDNMKRTMEGRANGDLPAENQGLNGMKWSDFPYFLEGTKGRIYVRLYPVDADGFRNMETKYFVNGIETTKEQALSFCTAKEKRDNPNPACINYGIDNITSVA